MAVKSSTLGDLSFRSTAPIAAFAPPHGGPYRYYRIAAFNGDDAVLTAEEIYLRTFEGSFDRMAVSEVEITEVGTNTVYPTSSILSTSVQLNDGVYEYTGGGLTVSSGYFHSSTYNPSEAFDNNSGSFWWSLGMQAGGESSDDNYLQIDMQQPRNISKFSLKMGAGGSGGYSYAEHIKIQASNDPTFATFTIFGVLNYAQSAIDNWYAGTQRETEIEINVGKVVQITQETGQSAPSVKLNADITYTSLLEGGISDEFGEHISAYKTQTGAGGAEIIRARGFGQTYLSAYYRGLTRNIQSQFPKYDASQSATTMSGIVYGGTNGAFLQVSFDPDDSDSFSGVIDGALATTYNGRSTKFTTKIESTSGKFSSEHIQTITYPGNLKNMFVRATGPDDENPFFISGALVNVTEDDAGVVHLVYYLNIADVAGANPGFYNLPSVSAYGDIAGQETTYSQYIWYSDFILPLSDVPRCDGQISSTAKTAKFQYDAGNSSSGDTLTAQAMTRAISVTTPGRWGAKLIPRHDDYSIFNGENGNLIKFSDFFGAQKRPELWEARGHHYKYSGRYLSGFDFYGRAEMQTNVNTLSTSDKNDRSTLFYSWKFDTPNMRTSYTEQGDTHGVIFGVPSSDNTGSVTEDVYSFGVHWGDAASSSSSRSDYRDYEWTTVLINHAQIDANVMDGTDTNGWFAYAGGNSGGNSDKYSTTATKRTPTRLTSSGLSDTDIYPLRGKYSWGGEDRTGSPAYDAYSYGAIDGINGTTRGRSNWYVYHINLPPNEISEFKVRLTGRAASQRFAKQDLFVLPGKWKYVTNSLESPTRTERSWSSAERYILAADTRQQVFYGDLMFHTDFSDYKYGPTSRVDQGYTTVPDAHVHETIYHGYQIYAGGAATKVVSITDPTDPSKDSLAGYIAYETLERAGRTNNSGYQGSTRQMPMDTAQSQSFVMRCVST